MQAQRRQIMQHQVLTRGELLLPSFWAGQASACMTVCISSSTELLCLMASEPCILCCLWLHKALGLGKLPGVFGFSHTADLREELLVELVFAVAEQASQARFWCLSDY